MGSMHFQFNHYPAKREHVLSITVYRASGMTASVRLSSTCQQFVYSVTRARTSNPRRNIGMYLGWNENTHSNRFCWASNCINEEQNLQTPGTKSRSKIFICSWGNGRVRTICAFLSFLSIVQNRYVRRFTQNERCNKRQGFRLDAQALYGAYGLL